MIGMLITGIGNPFYHYMVRAVQDVASLHHYSVIIANSDQTREKELLFCEPLIGHPVELAVIVPYHLTDDDLDNLIVRTVMEIWVCAQLTTIAQYPGEMGSYPGNVLFQRISGEYGSHPLL